MMRILLAILLFAPFSSTPVEVVIMDYSDLDPGEITAYHYDLPDEPDYCYCPW